MCRPRNPGTFLAPGTTSTSARAKSAGSGASLKCRWLTTAAGMRGTPAVRRAVLPEAPAELSSAMGTPCDPTRSVCELAVDEAGDEDQPTADLHGDEGGHEHLQRSRGP